MFFVVFYILEILFLFLRSDRVGIMFMVFSIVLVIDVLFYL